MTLIKAAAEPSREALLVELGARAIAESQGHDPDDMAPVLLMCTGDNQPVPYWVAFEEQSRACLAATRLVAPAGNAGVREAYETARHIIGHLEGNCGLSFADVKQNDWDTLTNLIAGLPQPREALAAEIKRADAAPPEASFDNASDMLGYLNAPREAETLDLTKGCPCEECEKDRAREAEPVAWQWVDPGNGTLGIITMNRAQRDRWIDEGYPPHALCYASPSPIPEARTNLSGTDLLSHDEVRGLIPEAPVGREEIARLICPASTGDYSDDPKLTAIIAEVYAEALITADAILRALKPQDGGESGR